MAQVCEAYLVFQPFLCTFVILIEMRQSKSSLICSINRCMHAIPVVCAMGAAVHVHPSLQLDLQRENMTVNTVQACILFILFEDHFV